ncbi:hypothetical protein ACLOJK_029131 [Asimina triloba]
MARHHPWHSIHPWHSRVFGLTVAIHGPSVVSILNARSDVYLFVGISIKRPSAPSLVPREHPEHTIGRVPVRRNFRKRPSAPFLIFSLAGAADKMHLPMHPPAEQKEETGDVQSPTEYGTPEMETSVPNEDYSGGGAQIISQPGQPDYAANPAVLHPSPIPSENTAPKEEEEEKATIHVMVAIGIMQTAASGVVAYLQAKQTATTTKNSAYFVIMELSSKFSY